MTPATPMASVAPAPAPAVAPTSTAMPPAGLVRLLTPIGAKAEDFLDLHHVPLPFPGLPLLGTLSGITNQLESGSHERAS
jgi:hypothetical protein